MRLTAPVPRRSVLALVGALVPRGVLAASAGDDIALAVIVAPTSKLTHISFEDLRNTFRSSPIGDGEGNHLIALNHPPRTEDRVGFDRVVLGMDPDAVGRFWIARKVRGESGPPRSVPSLTNLRRVVEKLPGAIGYIRPAQLSSQVRAIRVDGKLPEDPGYRVRYRP